MKGAVQQGVKTLAAGVDVLRRPSPGLVVLIYHRVGGVGGSVDLAPELFEEQVAALAASGRVRTLDAALDELDDLDPEAPGPVVLTFDDGTADIAANAVPILERHGVPALLYLATRFVDEGIEFPGGGPAISWGALAEATASGVLEVGSHTHSHVLLDRLPPGEVAGELDRSIDLIGEHLGTAPRHFAYPKAVAGSPEAEAEVRARFRSAALAGTRVNRPGRTDPHRLTRSPIQVADGMRWFQRKVNGGLAFEDTLRRGINRARYAGATT